MNAANTINFSTATDAEIEAYLDAQPTNLHDDDPEEVAELQAKMLAGMGF